MRALDEGVKISFAYHIQQAIFEKAFEKYNEYDGEHTSDVLKNPLDLDTMENADETDFSCSVEILINRTCQRYTQRKSA